MGLQINLHIYEWTTTADINKINASVIADSPGIQELYDEYTGANVRNFKGMFNKKGKRIGIFARDENEYSYDYGPEVWYCFDDDALKSIAKHVTNGRIVFHVEIEGNQDKYWVLENGKHRKGKLMVV